MITRNWHVLIFLHLVFNVADRFLVNAQAEHTNRCFLTVAQSAKDSLQGVRHDDLGWLVGRWRCIARRFRTAPFRPLDPNDALEYFNVYLPYADRTLTLNLSDNPVDRPIAAELLIRLTRVTEDHRLVERLVPYENNLGNTVCISKDRIWAGNPGEYEEFRYNLVTNEILPQLVLESRHTTTVFEKMPEFDARDMSRDLTNSFAGAPVRSLPESEREALALAYVKLMKTEKGRCVTTGH